jgi:integrase
LKGAKPLSASILIQKYLRPVAVEAGVVRERHKIRFGFHNFRHSLASAFARMKIDPKTVQEFLRQAHVTATFQLYADCFVTAL